MSRGEHMHGIAGLRNRLVVIAWTAALAAAPPAAAGLVLTDPGSDLYYTTALAAGTEIKVDKLCVVIGDVHSNKKVQVETEGRVEGDVVAAEQADVKGTVTGTVTSPAPVRKLPLLLTEAQARALADRVFEDDHDFVDAVIDDVVFVDGKARFFGSVGGVGTVIASGDLEVMTVQEGGGLALLGPSARLSLIAFKHVKVLEFRAVRGALYAGGDVILEKGTWFEGTAVANGKVDVKAGTRVSFLGLDTQPPMVAVSEPQPGSWTASTAPVVAGSFEDDLSGVVPASLRLLLDGVEVVPDTVSAAGFSFVPVAPLGEQFHTVEATFRDVAGNEGSARWFFGVDPSPPLLGVAAPPAEVVAGEGTVEILLSHLDPSSGVDPATLAVELDGTPLSCDVAAQLVLCQTAIGSGDHVLVARAADRVGNEAQVTHSFRFRLDLAAPQISLTQPTDGALVGDPRVTVAGTVIDDVEVGSVRVAGQPVEFSGGSFSTDLILGEGPGQVAVMAEDLLGRSTTVTAAVIVDTLGPGLIVDRPAAGSVVNDPEIEVVGRFEDENGLDHIEVSGVAAQVSGDSFAATIPLAEGANPIEVRAVDLVGNATSQSLSVTLFSTPSVRIDSPADLGFIAATTVDVAGEVSGGAVAVDVNGVQAQMDGTLFVAVGVPLIEGGNILTATARRLDGHVGTASINVVRDLTPPRLAVSAPADGSRVFAETVTVSGLVNDIVAGTVNASEAAVTVNGVPAAVANRSFVAEAVPLQPGANLLTVRAEDSGGNVAQTSVTVQRSLPDRPWLQAAGGDRQVGIVGEELAAPLEVVARDAAGLPVAGQAVLFKLRGDGHFGDGTRRTAVSTDAEGRAAVALTLGTRAGIGAQGVEARAPGFAGPVHFTFDVLPGAPASIVVDAGGQQLGIVGRPLPRPVVAAVIDAGANRLAGVPVRFRVVAGSGALVQNGLQEWVTETDSDGRAIAQLVLGTESGAGAHVVEAAVDGAREIGIASFTAAAVPAGPEEDTAIRGVVLDNTNLPVPGATLRILGSTLTTTTDDEGGFRLAPAPVGTVKLIVDGSTVQRPGAWPDLEFVLTTVPGYENDLGMPIFLLPLDLDDGVFVSETQGGVIELPEIPGFALEIAPGSATFPGGSKSGLVSVTAVHADRVPMVPNFGQQPRLIVTIQPAGARFDPPARLTLPNVEGLAPGQVTEFYSFDHDLGHFVSIGPGTVSDDGTVIVSNPGVGILKAGWHCGGSPSTTGTAHQCGECEKCVDDHCVDDDGKSCDDEDECTVNDRCQEGSCTGDPVRILSVEASLDAPVEDRACVGEGVQFRVDVEHENCEDIEYTWEFGDGATSSEQNPTHVFEEPGTYVVSVGVKCGNCPRERNGDSLVVEGVEDTTYELEYANFIPVSYVLGPPVLYDPFQGCSDGPAMVYSGDNRGADPDATSYRTKSAITVVPEEACSPNGVEGSPFKDVKPTKVYAYNALDDDVLDAEDDDATGDCDRLHLVETASTGEFSVTPQRMSPTAMKVHFEGNAKNPLAPISFGITWSFDVIVDSEAGMWTITGEHDCYPAHEAYIDNDQMHVRLPDSNSFVEVSTCLFPPTPNVNVDESGSLP